MIKTPEQAVAAASCALARISTFKSHRVQSFEFIGFKKSTEWHWVHRKCLDTK